MRSTLLAFTPLSHSKITLIKRVSQSVEVGTLLPVAKEIELQPHTYPKAEAVLKESHRDLDVKP